MITPDNMVLMATLPLPPSTNDLHRPVTRKRRDGTTYAAKIKDPAVAVYELQLKSLLNYPQSPWRSWQDKALIQAIQSDQSLVLDFRLWLYFTNNRSDADNRVKALQDMLARYLGIDDKRIINGKQHKRVHKECVPCAVMTLSIADIPDIWTEQAALDDLLTTLTESDKAHAKNPIVLH